MGNPKKNTALKLKNQPKTVKISNASSVKSSEIPLDSIENELFISLDRLNFEVVQKALVGDKISLICINDIFEVHVRGNRLGNIPIKFNTVISNARINYGKIWKVNLTPFPIAIIVISI